MATTITKNFIHNLLERVDIVEIVSSRVNLRKAGSNNFQALCPFHNEKSPSFTVSQRKQFYHCFGCGAHGNVINFLMEFEKLNFVEAIGMLAGHAGVEIPRITDLHQSSQLHLQTQLADAYALLENVSVFYQQQLVKFQAAIDYLKRRGLGSDICYRFKLGYAPAAWDNLVRLHTNNPRLKQQLLAVGMLLKKEGNFEATRVINVSSSNGSGDGSSSEAKHIMNSNTVYYARFRDRLMFPICDRRGRIIGFGGRTLGEDKPKYLNSPETLLFHKGNELYGLYEARQSNRSFAYIIVVEGYMDVISLAQHEITNVVATLGTAITFKQTQLLLQNCQCIIFCFDGDAAGKSAAWRALENVLPLMRAGVEIKFLFLPEKEDPDSMIRQEGRAAFIQRLTTAAIPLSSFLFQRLSEGINLNTLDGKAKLIQAMLTLLSKMANGVFKQLLLNKLAEVTKTDVDTILGMGRVAAVNSQFSVSSMSQLATSANIRGDYSPLLNPLQMAIGLLLNYPELVDSIRECDLEIITALDTLEARLLVRMHALIKEINGNSQTQQRVTLGTMLEYWREQPEVEYMLISRIAAWEPVISHAALKTEFDAIISKIREQSVEQTISALIEKANVSGLVADEQMKLQELIKLIKNKQA